MKKYWFALMWLVVGSVYAGELAEVVENGDLIFQRSVSRQSHAIAAATGSEFTHMGIIFSEGDRVFVYEAIHPVKKTPLASWVARGKDGAYVVRRLKDRSLLDEAKLKREVMKMVGRSYDFGFDWSDKKIYCSELVWKVYQRACGLKLGELKRFKDFNLEHPKVRALARARYGDHVPTEMLVIAPVDLFESPLLMTVVVKE